MPRRRKQLSDEDYAALTRHLDAASEHATAICNIVEYTTAKLMDRALKIERAIHPVRLALIDEREYQARMFGKYEPPKQEKP